MTTRTITIETKPTAVERNIKQWAAKEQPWADKGIHIQVRRFDDGRNIGIACEAVLLATGKLIASASHSTFTFDGVRKYLAQAA